jgi:hypothetical protein
LLALGDLGVKTGQLLLSALACAAATATAAHAQVSADEMSAGSPERRMTFGGSVRGDWDSNVNQSNTAAGAPSVSESDWIVTPSVRADIVQPIGRQAVFLQGTVGYTFYDKNDHLNSSRINVDGGVGGRLGPCGAVGTARYARSRVQIDDRFLTASVNNILELKTIGVSLTCVRAPGIGLQLSGGFEWGDNTETTREFNDFESTSATAGLVFGRPSLASMSAFTSYTKTEYPKRTAAIGQSGGYETVAFGLTAERRLGARINANASGSYSRVNLIDEVPIPGVVSAGKFNSVTYSGALSYRVSTRLTTDVNFSREVSPTLVRGQAFEIQTGVGAGATYKLGERVSLGLSGSYSKNDARGVPTNSPGILTEGETVSLFGNITYRQSRRLSFTLSGQLSERDSINPVYDFERQRVGVAANFTY